jgi:hypothetical protein
MAVKVWTNNRFEGHYPVGTAAVVVADTAEQAAEVLNNQLEQIGLQRSAVAAQFEQLSTHRQTARVLCDGDY